MLEHEKIFLKSWTYVYIKIKVVFNHKSFKKLNWGFVVIFWYGYKAWFLDKYSLNISYRAEIFYALLIEQSSWTLGVTYIFSIPDIKPANASGLAEIAMQHN